MTRAAQNDTTTPTLYLAFELGGSKWVLGFTTEIARPPRRRTLAANEAKSQIKQIVKEIEQAKVRFGLDPDAPVKSVYEAGRDGFWLDRALAVLGVENVVIEPASLMVDRRARRAKTDRLDLQELLCSLVRHHRGERVWRVVRVPSTEVEDLRHLSRRRERLVKEQTQHVVRIKSLLNLQGLKFQGVALKGLEEVLPTLQCPDGSAVGAQLLADVRDELARLRLVQAQLDAIKKLQEKLLKQAAPANPVVAQAQRLTQLKGIGAVSAFVLSGEFFAWREFRNRKQVGALAGLTDTPWKSDGIDRQQGISKAGNRRVRTLAVELSWGWLQHQPNSKLTRWYRDQTSSGKKRFKRVAIVAMARKLLVELWHFLDHGVVPQGAILSS